MQWMLAHVGDIVVIGILAAMAGMIIHSLVKKKGSGCSGCTSCSGGCHSCKIQEKE